MLVICRCPQQAWIFFLKSKGWLYGPDIELTVSINSRDTKHLTNFGRGFVQTHDLPGSQLIPNLAISCATELHERGIFRINSHLKWSERISHIPLNKTPCGAKFRELVASASLSKELSASNSILDIPCTSAASNYY